MTPTEFDGWLAGKTRSCIYYTGHLAAARLLTMCIRQAPGYYTYTGTLALLRAAVGSHEADLWRDGTRDIAALHRASGAAEAIGRTAWEACQAGRVELVQRRAGQECEYIAQRRR